MKIRTTLCTTILPAVAACAVLSACGVTRATKDEVAAARLRAEELQHETGRLITICMDGTWNVPPSATNVWQFHLIAKKQSEGSKVIPYYTEGVGTSLMTRKKGGKLGYGVESRVSDAYAFLCDTWRPGDRIVIVGFSRGAYQARLLAGVIDTLGIYSDAEATDHALPRHRVDARTCCEYFFYRSAGLSGGPLPRHLTGMTAPTRGKFYPADVDCLVCFDTVAAISPIDKIVDASLQRYAEPRDGLKRLFPTTRLALHAMALDEDRKAFEVVEFTDPEPTRLHQVWFAGSHSDIGGGYEPHGENQTALAWVIENLPDHIREMLGAPEPPLPPLNRQGSPIWVRGPRDEVPGSVLHCSVAHRALHDPSYRPIPDWGRLRVEAALQQPAESPAKSVR